MPEQTAVLLCLIGSYPALSELQHKTELTAAAAAAAACTGWAGGHHEHQQPTPASDWLAALGDLAYLLAVAVFRWHGRTLMWRAPASPTRSSDEQS